MLKIKRIPLQKVRFSNLETEAEDPDEGIDNEQFKHTNFSSNGIYNSMRNVSVRGFHKDDGSDLANVSKIKSVRKQKKGKMANRFDDKRVVNLEVRNRYDRGYGMKGKGDGGLNEYQQQKAKTLRWDPHTDFDDAGFQGTTSGISTEQGDPLIDIKKDSIQGFQKVEPLIGMRKYGSMKLRNLR
jgi:hypothetical protein